MEKARKIYAVILTVLFALWISLVFLDDPFQFYKEPKISKSENRNLARKPFFNPGLLDPYPKAYEAYYNDHFPFRPELIHMNTVANFFLFHKSPSPEDVALGTNGWFYLAQKEKLVFNGKFTLNTKQLIDLANELKRRAVLLNEMGTRFYVVFAPMKQEIYPEFLPPDYTRCPDGTVTDKIILMIQKCKGVNLIDLRKPLLEAKQFGRLYNKTDNHWNKLGSYYAYRAIIDVVRKDFPAIKPIELSDIRFKDTLIASGNLAIMTDLSDYLKEVDIKPYLSHPVAKPGLMAGYKPLNYWENPDDFEIVRETGDSSLPKALVIRDSFTNALMPYLNESFRKTVYIFDAWRYDYNETIVEHEKPDLVFLIIYEPHISHLIKM
jgi:alginate O-acetyltransferase complex protein AlgJ